MHRKLMTVSAAALGIVVAGGMVTMVAGADGQYERRAGARRLPADLPEVCEEQPRRPVEIADARLIIEYNATDGDLGVHGAFDDAGWRELCVFDPQGRPIAVFDPAGQLNRLGMAGVFFESREPPLDEFGFADLARAFPEGSYRVRASSFDGRTLVGRARFTHDVPQPPNITSPVLAGDADAPGPPISRRGLVVRWDPVTRTTNGDRADITGYQVIVTKEEHDDPNGFSRPVYDVHVGPDDRFLPVPPEFLDPGSVYEVEVLALEVSGNQTISVGFFQTA
jgi:hypothetical protein